MPRNSRPMHVFPIALRDSTVSRIVDVTPNLRRLTLTGSELRGGPRDGFDRLPFASLGFDDHVKLVFPDPDGHAPHPGQQADGKVAWNPEGIAASRDYTVRSVDLDADSFDIEVVRHQGGRAAEWAFAASVGHTISFAGPKLSQGVTPGVDWHLLVGDETALPAIARWLDEAPDQVRGQVLIEVADAADVQPGLRCPDGIQLRWVVRAPGVRAGWSTGLLDALTEVQPPAGRGFAWAAGEAMTMVPIRRLLRDQWGLAKQDVDVAGYWRRSEVAADAEPGSAAPSLMELTGEIHELSELLPPVLLRVAATLDLCGLILAGHTGADALAERTGVAARPLTLVLDAMASLGLLTKTTDGWTVTSLGEVIAEDATRDRLSLDHPLVRRQLALVDLLEVLHSGRPSARAALPTGEATADALADHAEQAMQYLADPIAAHPAVVAASSLTLLGHGAAIVAAALLEAHPALQLTLVTDLDRAAALGERLRGHGVDDAGLSRLSVLAQPADRPIPPADVVLALHLLDATPDPVAGELTERLVGAAGQAVLLVTDPADGVAHDDHLAADALLTLVADGVVPRTSAQLSALFADAGHPGAVLSQLGWGFGSQLLTVPIAQ